MAPRPDQMRNEPPDREELRLLQRLAQVYTPRPLSQAERGRFEARLLARLDRADQRAPWVPAAGLAASMAIAAWALFPRTAPDPVPLLPSGAAAGVAVLLATALEEDESFEGSGLPEFYALLDRLMEEPAPGEGAQ
jgi:hypothetical protein